MYFKKVVQWYGKKTLIIDGAEKVLDHLKTFIKIDINITNSLLFSKSTDLLIINVMKWDRHTIDGSIASAMLC